MNRQTQNYGSMSAPTVDFGKMQSAEFNSLTESVVTNMYTINASIRTLDNALKTIGTIKDNRGLRKNVQVTQMSTNQIASVTTKDLNKLKSLVPKGGKKSKLQVEKLEEDFKEAINKYYELQKKVVNKQKTNLLVSNESEVEPKEVLNVQKQAQVTRDLEFEQEMALDRENRIKEIEANVIDINQIMRDLGSMVHQQSEVIDTIESSIDHAVGNVESGTEQLVKASRYSNRARRKLLYLVIIAVIIVLILIGVIVAETK